MCATVKTAIKNETHNSEFIIVSTRMNSMTTAISVIFIQIVCFGFGLCSVVVVLLTKLIRVIDYRLAIQTKPFHFEIYLK